jgi:hypothetical protein
MFNSLQINEFKFSTKNGKTNPEKIFLTKGQKTQTFRRAAPLIILGGPLNH